MDTPKQQGLRWLQPPGKFLRRGILTIRMDRPSTFRALMMALSGWGAVAVSSPAEYALRSWRAPDGTRKEKRMARKEDWSNSMIGDSRSTAATASWARVKFEKHKFRFCKFFRHSAACREDGASRADDSRRGVAHFACALDSFQRRMRRWGKLLRRVTVSSVWGKGRVGGRRTPYIG